MIRCFISAVMLVLSFRVFANDRQKFQPRCPVSCQPNVAPSPQGGARTLAQSDALRQRLVLATNKKLVEEGLRAQLKQRIESVRGLAKRLEQTTEDSITQGGSLRQAMVEAKVETRNIDDAMKEIRDAVPKMREAGREMNRELDRMGGAK